MDSKELQQLKKEQNALILAHYYTDGAVQDIADYVGDSFYLVQQAAKTDKSTIIFCGVKFMGESAKIINPDRRVLMPDEIADCPMAHMASFEQIRRLRHEIPDLAVVCYINSSAALKGMCDVCVTSSNAVKIVSSLPNKNILFIPDDNLGSFIQEQLPDKKFYYCGGFCPIHASMDITEVLAAKEEHPNAILLVHPECKKEVRELATFIGSTSQIIEYAKNCKEEEIIVGTEPGVIHQMKKVCGNKKLYQVTGICPDMKRITLEKTVACLQGGGHEIIMEQELMDSARHSLDRMLELAK